MNGLSQLACHRLISPYFQANFNIYLPTFSYKNYRIIPPRTIWCGLTERTDGKMKKLTFEHQNNSFVVFELGLVPVFLLISHIQFQYFDFFFVLAFFLFISVQFFEDFKSDTWSLFVSLFVIFSLWTTGSRSEIIETGSKSIN